MCTFEPPAGLRGRRGEAEGVRGAGEGWRWGGAEEEVGRDPEGGRAEGGGKGAPPHCYHRQVVYSVYDIPIAYDIEVACTSHPHTIHTKYIR